MAPKGKQSKKQQAQVAKGTAKAKSGTVGTPALGSGSGDVVSLASQAASQDPRITGQAGAVGSPPVPIVPRGEIVEGHFNESLPEKEESQAGAIGSPLAPCDPPHISDVLEGVVAGAVSLQGTERSTKTTPTPIGA